uniref:Uncharacterized protein n=1 Tax=Myoviridae sp. ctBoB21 TaxID=2827287 RepID=A0A8S5R5T9_9CAUD|nr:MAG TPA: hypothetical protein [Myoviridae sp. ctBoB21]
MTSSRSVGHRSLPIFKCGHFYIPTTHFRRTFTG